MSKRKCTYCKEYFDKDDMLAVGVSAFCSQEHMFANGSKPKTTLKKKPKRQEVADDVVLKVLKLDDYRCRYCGKHTEELIMHHIVYRSEASHWDGLHTEDNLITLCNYPCHLFHVHGDKKKYQPLCLRIVDLRKQGDKTTTIQELENG
jgi:5-methylcytosine-specific restriction endonuclease McrA